MLELDVSAVTAVTVVASTRREHKKAAMAMSVGRRGAEAVNEAEKEAEIDWRQEQAHDVSRILGFGLELESSGLVWSVVDADSPSHRAGAGSRKMVTSSVTVSASITSQYASDSVLSAAYTTFSSAFISAFAVAAAASGYSTFASESPTFAPSSASTQIIQNSRSRIIIGVVVGVGGACLLAGVVYACRINSSKDASRKMRVESSTHQKPVGALEDEMGIEAFYGVDTWQQSTHDEA